MSEPILRRCKSCGALNRVPAARVADVGRCGSCKAPLPPLDEPVHAGAAAFDELIRESPVPVLVDFWATWCGPCRMSAPEVDAVAREMAGRAIVVKVDADAHPEIAARFQVQGIPNFVVIRDGRVLFQQAGVVPRSEMRGWLERAGARAA